MQEAETVVTPATPTPDEGLTPPSELGVPAEPLAEPPAEGQGEGEEGQKPPITSWEEAEQAEWFPAALEERDKVRDESRDNTLRQEMKREAYREFDPHMQRQEATLNNLYQEGMKLRRTMKQMVDDQTWDGRSAENWAADHQDFINALNGAYWGAGIQRTLNQLAEAAGDRHLISDMHNRLVSFLQGQHDPSFMEDFVGRLAEPKVKEGIKAAEEKGYQRGLKENRAALAAQQQVQQAQGAGANLAPGSPAGSGKTPEQAWVEAGCPESGALKEAYQTWRKGQAI